MLSFATVIIVVLQNGAIPSAPPHSGRTRPPLHLAAEQGAAPDIRRLARVFPRGLNLQDSDGATPLHIAASLGHHNTVRALVKAGANMNIQDSAGRTPLHRAVAVLAGYSHRHASCVRALIELGAPVSSRYTDHHGRTPLHVAVATMNIEAVATLAKPWFDIEATDSAGYTAARLASEMGLIKAVQTLEQAGARFLPEWAEARGGDRKVPLTLRRAAPP